jgi:DNA repair protein RadC
MEEKPHYLGHRKRVREKFLKIGGAGFADYEILEILLFSAKPRNDVKPLAKKLIAKFGSLPKVISADAEELDKVEGVGEAAIVTLKIAQEVCLRMLKDEIEKKQIIGSWKALLEYCRASMGHNKTEQFRIFFLDLKNRLIADELQQKGTVDHTPVYPREVIKRALELGATSIILAHNHPSGDPEPSKTDIEMTRKIMLAAQPVNIQIHDHIVIGGAKHYSFKANGLI